MTLLWTQVPIKADEKRCPWCEGYGIVPANREKVTVKNNCYKCYNCGGSGKDRRKK